MTKELPIYLYVPISRKERLVELLDIDVMSLSDFELDFWVAVSEGYVMNPYILRSMAHMVKDGKWVLPGKRILPNGSINCYSYYPSSNGKQASELIILHNIRTRKNGTQWDSVIPGNSFIISGIVI